MDTCAVFVLFLILTISPIVDSDTKNGDNFDEDIQNIMKGISSAVRMITKSLGSADFGLDDKSNTVGSIISLLSSLNPECEGDDCKEKGSDGSSGYENLRDIVQDLGLAFNTVSRPSADCVYKCPEGENLVAKENHTPIHNGCGTFGIEFIFNDIPGLTNCCNHHDICYSTCLSDKETCDLQLQTCTKEMCVKAATKNDGDSATKEDDCSSLAEVLYKATGSGGCSPFYEAQMEACKCIKSEIPTKEKIEL